MNPKAPPDGEDEVVGIQSDRDISRYFGRFSPSRPPEAAVETAGVDPEEDAHPEADLGHGGVGED